MKFKEKRKKGDKEGNEVYLPILGNTSVNAAVFSHIEFGLTLKVI